MGGINAILPAYLVSSWLTLLLAVMSILAEDSTNAQERSTILIAGTVFVFLCVIPAAFLRCLFGLDPNGRVTPRTHQDAAHPHWSALLLFGLMDLAYWIAPTAAADISQVRLQPAAAQLPTPTSQLSKMFPWKHVLVAVVSTAAGYCSPLIAHLFSQPPDSVTVLRQHHTRELFSTYTGQEGGNTPWWLGVAGYSPG